jgi:hypothetical protein
MHDEGMAPAEKVACGSYNTRCFAVPDRLDEARKSCTPKGRCRIGGTREVILANSGRESGDAWLDLHTGKGRLRGRAQ